MVLNMTFFSKITFFIHEPYHEIGLFYNYWVGEVVTRTVRKGVDSDTTLSLRIRKKRQNAYCEPDPDYSQAKCVLEWAKRTFLNANNTCKTGKRICICI